MSKMFPIPSLRFARLVTTSALAIALTACGGGSGGGTSFGSISAPPPPPGPPQPPPPPPPPPGFVNIFPNITTNTNFSVLGYEANGINVSVSQLVGSGFAVRFDAASDSYIIDLPISQEGRFNANGEDLRFWYGNLADAGGQFLSDSPIMSVFKPLPTNPDMVLQHTTFGLYQDFSGYYYDYDDRDFTGVFAFGTPTPASAIPTTGSAIFDAIVAGFTLDTSQRVGGSASLQFNFGTGTLAGSFNPLLIDSMGAQTALGTYGFVNTVFGIGSTTFSGQLQNSSITQLGTFNGLFTGPAAQELMARWTAPYKTPDKTEPAQMFGVWVGKKQ